ncbi:serum response factor-binding protein 1-like isoform X2 [Corticium candelabrum]|uniref:serum response factor-binding protein 1-like isoform X2 n=1 Tax=Corticium candelabrum TaxID=121492 RepID=UPI002E26D3AC|nr:serum response factor-binding protein 1-like isoform X2 [Corticium candelabrum]
MKRAKSGLLKKTLKRARVREVRRLSRQAQRLRTKKGTDMQVAKNERKAVRMLEELQALKDLDMTALIKELQECKSRIKVHHQDEPQADLAERAKRRLMTNDVVMEAVGTQPDTESATVKRTTESTGTGEFGIELLARQDVSNSTDSTDTTNSTPITTFLSCVGHQSSKVAGKITHKKNRKGQRARRKLWQEKFGSKAKHIDHGITSQYARCSQRNKFEQHEAVATTATLTLPIQSKKTRTTASVRTTDHPSWEASKRRRAQEQAISSFSGTKIILDSD